MATPQVIIEIRNGVLVDVYATDPTLQVALVDWDCDESDSPHSVEVEIDGKTEHAFVIQLIPQPLSVLIGSDVEQAMEASTWDACPC